jgi:hypothetical protein
VIKKIKANKGTIPQQRKECHARFDASVGVHSQSLKRKTRFLDLFPPFTCLCAVLCFVFATLGLIALLNANVVSK